ncbi:MAG: LysR substrate-binding domain-containing protein [Janibacter sp.]
MIDFHRLAIWRAVVASGSVGGAAANLGYRAATVSQHIITLQRALGITLYERSGRGIEPTTLGVRLAEESTELFTSARRLEHLIDDLRTGVSPRLTIGTFASAAKVWLPPVVVGLTRDFPDVQLEIDIHTPGAGPGERSRDIEIDDEVPTEGPCALAGYRRHPLTEDAIVAVVARDHPLAGRSQVSVIELRDETWIDHDLHDRATGRVTRLACRSAGFEPHYAARSDDHYAVLAMVGAGAGVALIPELAIGGLPPDVCAVPLVDPTPTRRITMQVRDTSAHRPDVLDAQRLIEQAAAPRE